MGFTSCAHMMLISEGADRFAVQQGLQLCDPAELISPAEYEAWLHCRRQFAALEGASAALAGTFKDKRRE